MHVLIVLAHPDNESFNSQLTAAARSALEAAGHVVTISDLYAAKFDPVEDGQHYGDRLNTQQFVALAEQRHASKNGTLPRDVQLEIEKLEAADLVILQFPLWWHGPPAVLKGWFDRVFVSGHLYNGKMRYETGYFRGKRAIVSVTTGAPASAFGPGARGGEMGVMLWPIHYSLHYLGFSILAPEYHFEVSGHGYSYSEESENQKRLQANIEDWSKRVAHLDYERTLTFSGWANWAEDGSSKSPN